MLVSLSESYSKLNLISVGVSGPSSCPTLYHLTTTYTTNYYSKEFVNKFVLRKMFYSRQDFRNICCPFTCTSHKWTLQYRALILKNTSILLDITQFNNKYV